MIESWSRKLTQSSCHKFQLDGSTGFNAVFDDQNFKGSHAGHICRVAFAPKQIRLGDDKEGVIRNDIFAMRKDRERKAEAARLLAGRNSSAPVSIEQKTWHQAVIEIVGEAMRVSLDGKPAKAKAQRARSSFHHPH